MIIEPARPEDAAAITDVGMASKAHWGYDAAFMEACREDLTVTEDDVVAGGYWTARSETDLAGYVQLSRAGADPYLLALFVAPEHIGHGVGTALWQHAVTEARGRGWTHFLIDADPHAEAFYVGRGARRVGEVPSGSIPGRMLPLMRFDLR